VAALTKRYSERWQASATYTLGAYWDETFQPMSGFQQIVPFTVAPDLGGEYTLATADQRHRAVMNGIWEVGRGFQASGLIYHGSGIRDASLYSGDLRQTGAEFSNRLRPDNSLIPRNSYIQPAENRIDLRLQQRIPLGGRAAVDLIGEVFNLFNTANYVEITDEASPQYGQPGVGFYRTMQFGFRVTF
jgi:hypothetical protein